MEQGREMALEEGASDHNGECEFPPNRRDPSNESWKPALGIVSMRAGGRGQSIEFPRTTSTGSRGGNLPVISRTRTHSLAGSGRFSINRFSVNGEGDNVMAFANAHDISANPVAAIQRANTVKQGSLLCEDFNGEWVARWAMLSVDQLGYADAPGEHPVDFVNLVEVKKVRTGIKSLEDPGAHLDMILQVDGREGVVNRDNETCGVIHTIRQRMGLVTGSPRYSGNVFVLRARSQVERDEWVRMIRTSMLLAKQSDAKNAYSWAYLKYRAFSMKMRPYQSAARRIYMSDKVQILLATVISINFLITAVESQINPDDEIPELNDLFAAINIGFTCFFTLELIGNMFGSFWKRFWADFWNWGDTLIVIFSFLSSASNIPGVNILRIVRALRVCRLFKRLPALRQMIVALSTSIQPVFHAFCVLLLVTSVYSILGVTFFGKVVVTDSSGIEQRYFQTFTHGLFTMFQTLTGDGWASEVARPIMRAQPYASLFFVSYILVAGMVLTNVMVAVLIEEFTKAGQQQLYEDIDTAHARAPGILEEIARGLVECSSAEEEDLEITRLWATMDLDGNGVIDIGELKDGLLRCLPADAECHEVNATELDVITMNGRLCDVDGNVSFAGFKLMLKRAVANVLAFRGEVYAEEQQAHVDLLQAPNAMCTAPQPAPQDNASKLPAGARCHSVVPEGDESAWMCLEEEPSLASALHQVMYRLDRLAHSVCEIQRHLGMAGSVSGATSPAMARTGTHLACGQGIAISLGCPEAGLKTRAARMSPAFDASCEPPAVVGGGAGMEGKVGGGARGEDEAEGTVGGAGPDRQAGSAARLIGSQPASHAGLTASVNTGSDARLLGGAQREEAEEAEAEKPRPSGEAAEKLGEVVVEAARSLSQGAKEEGQMQGGTEGSAKKPHKVTGKTGSRKKIAGKEAKGSRTKDQAGREVMGLTPRDDLRTGVGNSVSLKAPGGGVATPRALVLSSRRVAAGDAGEREGDVFGFFGGGAHALTSGVGERFKGVGEGFSMFTDWVSIPVQTLVGSPPASRKAVR